MIRPELHPSRSLRIVRLLSRSLILMAGVIGAPALSVAASDPRIPDYQLYRPKWAVGLSGSMNGLGKEPGIPGFGDARANTIQIQVEYQPQMIQKFGILGIGPTIGLTRPTPLNGVGGSIFSLWSVGGQVRYQARYFREQVLVPMAGYSFQSWSYALEDGTSGRVMASGPFFGAYLLLNFFDPKTAAEAYVNWGISRTYLVAEMRTMSGSDDTISLDGSSLFFGLRFEF